MEWCWLVGNRTVTAQIIYGKFENIKELHEDINKYMKRNKIKEIAVTIGQVEYLDPKKYVSAKELIGSVDHILKVMTDNAIQDLKIENKNNIFLIEDKYKDEAIEDLECILKSWATAYISSPLWTMQEQGTRVLKIEDSWL
jgi:hypothetical protein